MEHNAKTKAIATHEIKVIRADGTPEEVLKRQLTLEETETLIEVMRASSPEAKAAIDEKLSEAEKEEDNG